MVLTRIADPDVLIESGFFLSVGSCFEVYFFSPFFLDGRIRFLACRIRNPGPRSSLLVYNSDIDPDPVGSAFIWSCIRIQRYKMKGKAEFNQQSLGFSFVRNDDFQV